MGRAVVIAKSRGSIRVVHRAKRYQLRHLVVQKPEQDAWFQAPLPVLTASSPFRS
jgi:hypothetical protein